MRTALAIAVLWLAPLSAYAQAARWVQIEPLRTVNIPGTLGEIDSQLPAGHIYRDADPCTWAHETTHGINAIRLRNAFGMQNGFYCRNRRGFLIQSPRFTLRALANRIPANKRGGVYSLYMVQQQSGWNDTPLYCLDECSAYVNGCVVALEMNQRERSLDSFWRALELWTYAREAQRMAREQGFAQQAALDQFMDEFHRTGIHYLLVEYRRRGWR